MNREKEIFNQKFKIFGRKKGKKSLSKSSYSILEKYNFKTNAINRNKKIILEIGSGDGDYSLYLSQKNPNQLIIASDIYLDGNINLCKKVEDQKIKNIKIFNKNALIFFDELKMKNICKEIWLLFPDPWPKKKHHKRRIIKTSFLNKVYPFLIKKGKIYIATDCKNYFLNILRIFSISRKFKWVNDLPYKWDYCFNNSFETKYFKKALRNNRKSYFIVMQKI